MMNADRRVVVTGSGVVTCLGHDVPTLWEGLLAGKSGIVPISCFDASEFRCQIGGEIRNLDFDQYMPAKEARRLDPFCQFAVVAADEAVKQAGLADSNVNPERVGVMVGSGIGGIQILESQCQVLHTRGPSKTSPLIVPMMISDMAAGFLSIRHNFQGPNIGIVTACATGSHSLGEAMWVIKRGDADVMLAGGTEACLSPLGITGFAAMKALTTNNSNPTGASRPFDRDRDGFVPAEGAGILVLEALDHALARNANILAEIVGYGATGDAFHITAPDSQGRGATRAICNALAQAQLNPEDVDYINAHGTSTPLNDKLETMAIKQAFGEAAARTVAISSSKSMLGHSLGAAGGIESIVCVQSLCHDVVHGTINYQTPDPECDLDYVPNHARQTPVRVAMNINLGFGGHNAVLIFKKFTG